MLFSNAKDNIGFDEVHAICEAMVEAYFFRFEPAHANMGRLAKWVLWSRPKVTRVWLVDVTQSTVPDQEGDFRAHLNFIKKVAKLAGISVDSFNGLLRTYLPIFQWEMKQRDFQLMTSCENHRMGVVSGWQLERLASCPKP